MSSTASSATSMITRTATVRNERSGDRVRQHTLLNLGSTRLGSRSSDGTGPQQCARIQQLLDAELVPLSCPQEVGMPSDRRCATPQSRTARRSRAPRPADGPWRRMIRRSVGVEDAITPSRRLVKRQPTRRQRATHGQHLARMAAPGSEPRQLSWLSRRSALGSSCWAWRADEQDAPLPAASLPCRLSARVIAAPPSSRRRTCSPPRTVTLYDADQNLRRPSPRPSAATPTILA